MDRQPINLGVETHGSKAAAIIAIAKARAAAAKTTVSSNYSSKPVFVPNKMSNRALLSSQRNATNNRLNPQFEEDNSEEDDLMSSERSYDSDSSSSGESNDTSSKMAYNSAKDTNIKINSAASKSNEEITTKSSGKKSVLARALNFDENIPSHDEMTSLSKLTSVNQTNPSSISTSSAVNNPTDVFKEESVDDTMQKALNLLTSLESKRKQEAEAKLLSSTNTVTTSTSISTNTNNITPRNTSSPMKATVIQPVEEIERPPLFDKNEKSPKIKPSKNRAPRPVTGLVSHAPAPASLPSPMTNIVAAVTSSKAGSDAISESALKPAELNPPEKSAIDVTNSTKDVTNESVSTVEIISNKSDVKVLGHVETERSPHSEVKSAEKSEFTETKDMGAPVADSPSQSDIPLPTPPPTGNTKVKSKNKARKGKEDKSFPPSPPSQPQSSLSQEVSSHNNIDVQVPTQVQPQSQPHPPPQNKQPLQQREEEVEQQSRMSSAPPTKDTSRRNKKLTLDDSTDGLDNNFINEMEAKDEADKEKACIVRPVSTALLNTFELSPPAFRAVWSFDEVAINKKLRAATTPVVSISSEESVDIEKTVEMLRRAVDTRDPTSARQAATKVSDLCVSGGNRQAALGQFGACPLVTSLLWGWLKEQSALEAALGAVANLCRHEDVANLAISKNIQAMSVAGAFDMVVGTMQRNLLHEMICEKGCLAITHLADGDEQRIGLGVAGACEIVVMALSHHMKNSKVVEAASCALKVLSLEKGNIFILGRVGVCRVLVAVLNLPIIQIDSVTANCCATIGNVAVMPESVDAIVDAQCVQSVVEALAKWKDNAKVSESCCLAISKMAAQKDLRDALGRCGACEVVVASWTYLLSSEPVSIAACLAIIELARGHNVNAERLRKADVSELIISVMRTHHMTVVDEVVCGAVYHLCQDNSELLVALGAMGVCALLVGVLERTAVLKAEKTAVALTSAMYLLMAGSSVNQTAFGLAGACRHLVKLLDGWSEQVQIGALWCIALLCRYNRFETSLNDVNCAHFLMANAHVELLTILATVRESTRMGLDTTVPFVEAVLLAVRNLSMRYASSFGRRGLQLVLDIAGTYRKEPRVVMVACGVMRWLAEDSELVLSTDGEGICRAVISALEEHIKVPGTCEAACCTIVKLAAYQDTTKFLVSLGVCQRVVSVLRTHLDVMGVTLSACITIKELLAGCFNANEFLSRDGCCEAVVKALSAYNFNVALADIICCIIHQLGTYSASNVGIFHENGAGTLAIGVLRDHVASKETAVQACMAITVLAGGDIDYRQGMGSVTSCEALVKALRLHTTDIMVTQNACRAIHSICQDVPKSVECFSELDVCAAVKAVLENAFHKQQQELAAYSAKAITALCTGNGTNQERFGAIGTCELVVNCLYVSWVTDTWVNECLLFAVAYLCRYDSLRSTTSKRNLNLLVTSGAIKAAVSALKRNKDSVGLSKAACIAIRNLAYDESTKVLLGKETACERVCDALVEHGYDAYLVEYAAGAIANLAGPRLNLLAFADLGAYDLIARYLKSFLDNESVTLACCGAIINLTAGSEDDPSLKRTQQDRFGALEVHQPLVYVLRRYLLSVNLTTAACGAIMNLSEGHAESSTVFGAAGACEFVAEALTKHGVANLGVAVAACSALWCLASENAKNRRKFGIAAACEVVVSCLMRHMEDPSAAEHCCLAIRHLADGNSENSAILGGAGACEAVIKVLSIHVGDASVAEAASGAVVSLSTNNQENAKRLGSFGASDEVVRSLQKSISSTDEALAATTASAICRLTSNSPENQQSLGTAGACELIVRLLGAWEKKPHVESVVLHAIACLCRHGSERSTTNAYNVNRMIKAGAFEIILRRIGDLINDSDVCSYGCLALRNLAFEHDHQFRLGVLGACEVLMTVFKRHLSLPNVTDKVCGAISNLSLVLSNAANLAHHDVFTLLGKAFQTHVGILDTALAVCGAVVNLTASGNKENAAIVESSGIFKSVIKGLTVHIENTYMGMAASLAISNLIQICEGQSRDEFVALGACEAVLSVLQHHGEHTDAVANGFRALYNLAYENESAKDRFGRLGACEVVVRIMLKHTSSAEVSENACLAIRNLAANHMENKSRLGGVGGCYVVIKTLETHPDSLAVAEAACLAVRNLSGNHTENVTRLGEADACRVLLSVFRTFVSSETVCEQACASLANLVANNDPQKAELGQHDAAVPIVQALQIHKDNPKIVAHISLLV